MVFKLPGLRLDAYGVFSFMVVYKVDVFNPEETTFNWKYHDHFL